jgi:pimeloyl-ACP methyl ester carboxylesterase
VGLVLNFLLLRGLSRDSRHWLNFPDFLKKKKLIKNLYLLDLPGFGESIEVDSPHKVEEIVDFLRIKWAEINEKGPTIIVSVSFGGMVAINWISRFPDDFKAIVVMNSSLPKLSPRFKRIKPRAFIDFIRMFSYPDYESREKLILELTSNNSENVGKYLKLFSSFQVEKPATKKNTILQIIAARNIKVPDEIKIPSLFLTSRHDRLVDYSCSEKIADHLNGRLEINEVSGHDLTLDEPEWVADKIYSWLEELKLI